MSIENNADGLRRTITSRAAMERAAEYNTGRAEEEKNLSDRYIAVQDRLNELEINKDRGAKSAVNFGNPALEDLAIQIHKATLEEMRKLQIEKEELEKEMSGKGIDHKKYVVHEITQ